MAATNTDRRPTAAWDPAQYLQFSDQRLRPALDLLGQVRLDAPAHIVDLGCGAGNVSVILKQRFPAAEVVGVDSSASMLEKARAAAPACRFEQGDFATWQPAVASSLIYSNAALQWVGGHAALFPRLMSLLAPGGVLAVQMLAMGTMHRCAGCNTRSRRTGRGRRGSPVMRPRHRSWTRPAIGTCCGRSRRVWISGRRCICIH